MTFQGFEPARSSLLMKASRGTPYLKINGQRCQTRQDAERRHFTLPLHLPVDRDRLTLNTSHTAEHCANTSSAELKPTYRHDLACFNKTHQGPPHPGHGEHALLR
jgi:hypothetical protein